MQPLNLKRSIGFFVLTMLFSFILINTSSAKLFNVDVSNIKFTPKDISISAGDTVKWTNTQGSHNVNGAKSVYPSNPETFGNSVGGAGWEYTFVFTISGKYDYQCDPHINFGMVGTVTVETTNEVNETQIAGTSNINIFPNPVNENANIFYYINEPGNVEIEIYNSLGNKITTLVDEEQEVGSHTAVFDGSGLPSGMYYFKVHTGEQIKSGKLLLIK